MQLFNRFTLALGIILMFTFSIFGMLYAMNILRLGLVSLWMERIYEEPYNRLTLGGISAFLLTISLLVFFSILKSRRLEQTIAFRNALGEVRISLVAIEDFIKRIGSQLKEVKEIKPRVEADKKGIVIYNRVTLWSNSNITGATEELQNTIQRYVQSVLGLEGIREIKVFVEKIAPPETKKEEEERLRGIEFGRRRNL